MALLRQSIGNPQSGRGMRHNSVARGGLTSGGERQTHVGRSGVAVRSAHEHVSLDATLIEMASKAALGAHTQCSSNKFREVVVS